MDDNSFDKIIKDKVESFEDTAQDPRALADMRQRLAHLPTTKSSWNPSRAASIAAALLVFTLINFGIVWYFSEGRYVKLTEDFTQLRMERDALIDLQEELIRLKSSKVDTVYVFREFVNSIGGGAATAGLNPLAHNYQPSDGNRNQIQGQDNSDFLFYKALAENQQLSRELETLLVRNNLLLIGDKGGRFLVLRDQAIVPVRKEESYNAATGPILPSYLPKVFTLETNRASLTEKQKKSLSNKTLWALQKHAQSGLDFQFGVEGIIGKTSPEYGRGDYNSSLGILTEVIFSPALRLETGLHLGTRSYSIRENEIENLTGDVLDKYTGLDLQSGKLIRLESDADVVKIPVNLKLMGLLDHNKRWYLSAGVTPHWYTHQEFDYQYAIDGSDPDDEFRSYIGAKQVADGGFYLGTLNVGLGTEVYLNEKYRWQIGAYYEKGLSGVGAENINIQGFGLKSSFWLNKP